VLARDAALDLPKLMPSDAVSRHTTDDSRERRMNQATVPDQRLTNDTAQPNKNKRRQT